MMKADEMVMLDGFEEQSNAEFDAEEERLRREICGESLQISLDYSVTSKPSTKKKRGAWSSPKSKAGVQIMYENQPTAKDTVQPLIDFIEKNVKLSDPVKSAELKVLLK
jgi:hypothetical protein